jgi:germination protein YpeB
MLAKLRAGETLTEKDEETLQGLYQHAERVKTELSTFVSNVTEKDFMSYIKKGEGEIQALFQRLEDATLPENADMPSQIMPRKDGAGMERTPISKEEQGATSITPAQAEEMCKTYFSAYKINEFQCIGETVARGYTAYNLQGYDDKGTLLFAELDYKNGELIRFDYYEECSDENFDMENAQMLADNFLEKLGYEDMTVVRARENGTDLDFTYLYEKDGVVYYPDAVHVKVCRSRGVVTGFDASKYLRNHTRREDMQFTMPIEKAQNKLHNGLTVESARKTVVHTMRGERAAYEFVCAYNEQRYVIYTDATNGEELAILNVDTLG